MARGYRSSRQNLEAVGTGPWISRLCSLQNRWATRSPLLCRCPAGNLGFATESGDHGVAGCPRRERPHNRAAEQRYEHAAFHSRTSLARAMNTSDKEMQSEEAVLRPPCRDRRIRVVRQAHREHRSLAPLARHGHIAAHHARELRVMASPSPVLP